MEKLVVTDGYTLNPGDLSWNDFKAFGEVRVYDRTTPDEMAVHCKGASVIITNKTPVTRQTIEATGTLKAIAVTATGYNIVDVAAAAERNIPVCNVPGYDTDSVAQHTFALLLELTNHVGANAATVSRGYWSRSPDFCYSVKPIVEISGKTLGIVGFGRIGRKVAEIAHAFGMQVIYHSNHAAGVAYARQVSLETLFAGSDFVSLHCPLKADNLEFVNEVLLSRMKPTACLINTARGQLIRERDLAEALKSNRIAGAALDVLSAEPPPADHVLIHLENCLITPHNAWLSFEARQRILNTTLQNVRAALTGSPANVVRL
jgi:glycerate dehydrogenase